MSEAASTANADMPMFNLEEIYGPPVNQLVPKDKRERRRRAAELVSCGNTLGLWTDTPVYKIDHCLATYITWNVQLNHKPLHMIILVGESATRNRYDLADARTRAREELLHNEVLDILTFGDLQDAYRCKDLMDDLENKTKYEPLTIIFVTN